MVTALARKDKGSPTCRQPSGNQGKAWSRFVPCWHDNTDIVGSKEQPPPSHTADSAGQAIRCVGGLFEDQRLQGWNIACVPRRRYKNSSMIALTWESSKARLHSSALYGHHTMLPVCSLTRDLKLEARQHPSTPGKDSAC